MIEGEEKLISAARAGDTASFDALYSHYIPAIYRFVYMKVSHREEAEDLTHEVFLLAWQNLHRYTSRGFPFSSWLYQIARNKVIDHYRLKKPNISLEDTHVDLVKIENQMESDVDQELSLEKIKTVLHELTPDQQDVILMKFMEDCTHAEIAVALGKSQGAIRLLQHRAINELKRKLKEL